MNKVKELYEGEGYLLSGLLNMLLNSRYEPIVYVADLLGISKSDGKRCVWLELKDVYEYETEGRFERYLKFWTDLNFTYIKRVPLSRVLFNKIIQKRLEVDNNIRLGSSSYVWDDEYEEFLAVLRSHDLVETQFSSE